MDLVWLLAKTNFLEVRARAMTPHLAERRANAVVEAYIDYIEDDRARVIEDALQEIEARLDNEVETRTFNTSAVDLLSSVGRELEDIVQSVEDTTRRLEQLHNEQRASSALQPVLDLEMLQVQEAAEDLDNIVRNLERIGLEINGRGQQAASNPQSLSDARSRSNSTSRKSKATEST